jgi:hypothetical protein
VSTGRVIELMDGKEAARVCRLLKERHRRGLRPGEEFQVRGWVQDEVVYATLTLRNQDESLHYPMEARLDVADSEQLPEDALDVLLDFLDYYVGQYLERDRDVYLTIDWSEVRFGESVLQARGQVLNLKLERMADEILARGEVLPGEK